MKRVRVDTCGTRCVTTVELNRNEKRIRNKSKEEVMLSQPSKLNL